MLKGRAFGFNYRSCRLCNQVLLYQLPLVMAPNTIFCGPCTSLFSFFWGMWVWVGIQEYLARAPSPTLQDPGADSLVLHTKINFSRVDYFAPLCRG
jgi:hypothetical protein